MLPYDDVGSGPPVVLLHAGVCDRSMWTETAEALADAGFRAVALDLPGHGDAPPQPDTAPHAAVLEALDEIGLDRVALVGNSFGAGVALAVAATAPERLSSLFVLSALSPILDEPSAELGAVWEAEEEALDRGDIDAAVDAVVRAWVDPAAPAGVRERVSAMQRRAFVWALDAEGGERELDDPAAADDGAVLERVTVPVTVAVGEREFADIVDGARWLGERLTGGNVETIAGAGHLAPLEQPERFQRLLLAHLARG